MTWDPNKSPCRACRQNIENEVAPIDAYFKKCTATCVELWLHQAAMVRSEKLGLPKPGVCATCRRPCEVMYCQGCKVRAGREIERRAAPPPPPKTKFGPKTRVYKDFKWFEITKKSRPGRCQYCDGIVEVGKPVLARHTAPSKGNYRYAHRSCVEEARKAA